MARKTSKELQEIMKKNNTDRIFSWSRVNSYKNSKYEYFLKYVLRKPEDRDNSIYSVMGGMSHDIMERLYTNLISHSDMADEYDSAWITANIAELKFDRSDPIKNKNISDNYHKNLEHFFKNHITIPYKMDIERFITIKLGDNLLQGYIDAVFKDDDGCFNIIDWKTSSIYSGKKIENESGQLVLYAIGMHQLGIPFDKIKIGWNFMKYVAIDCEQANGKWTKRNIERNKIGSALQGSVKMWLKKLGYEDELLEYLDLLAQTNNIECLPKDVQEKYKVNDCIVYIDLDSNLVNKWTKEITSRIDEIIKKEEEYKLTKDDSIFCETEDEVKAQSYYFANLCSYSANLHKPYKKYLDRINTNKVSDGVFGARKQKEDSDLSWLDSL